MFIYVISDFSFSEIKKKKNGIGPFSIGHYASDSCVVFLQQTNKNNRKRK